MSQRKRAAIVGTAESWRQCPFDDPGLYIASLNDAYMLKLPRADEWHELHPVDKFVYRRKDQKVVAADAVPPGHYVRPDGHLGWLKTQAATIPVWLQATPPNDWPANAQRLPIEALQEHFGVYWASGPAYMLMHLYLRGFRDISIYGIHLATEHEYREQRPNFEFLIGRLLGPSVKESVRGSMRVWEGAEVTISVPQSSPILAHGWRYAFEPKPEPPPNPYLDELNQTHQARAKLLKRIAHMPEGPDRVAAVARMEWMEIVELDCRQQVAKQHLATPIVCEVAA